MKIENITLGSDHKGAKVVYKPSIGISEKGTIISWNDHYVFVEYENKIFSQATNSKDLFWGGSLNIIKLFV